MLKTSLRNRLLCFQAKVLIQSVCDLEHHIATTIGAKGDNVLVHQVSRQMQQSLESVLLFRHHGAHKHGHSSMTKATMPEQQFLLVFGQVAVIVI